ncbi:MAG: hypothetical protein ACHREM_22155 [Polyangiales bacterium]
MAAAVATWTVAPIVVGAPLVTWTQQSEVASGSFGLGWAIAVDGDTALAGSPYENDNTGAAYLFTHAGTTWTLDTKLVGGDSVASDDFGAAVAVSGGWAIVGAPYAAASAGAAYIFQQSGLTWTQVSALKGVSAGDEFGYSVAMDGDTALVGAPFSSTGATVTVYTQKGTTSWLPTQVLTPTQFGVAFGFSVAIQGDTALVGEPEDTATNGVAFVFTRSGTTWSRSATLRPSALKLFGTSVALDGDTAIVGSPYDSGEQGSAYVFARSGTTWTQQGQLLAPDPFAGDKLGWSVAIRGDSAIVGAPFRQFETGAAYSFQRSGTSWVYTSTLVALDFTKNTEFGQAVAMRSDGTTLLGSYGAGTGVNLVAGAVYVFVPQLTYGTACAVESDCAYDYCVDGVCCATSACDTCGTCNGTNPGHCTPKPLGAPPTTTCGEYLCDGSAMTCVKACTANEACIGGDYCASSDNTCYHGARCSPDHSTATDRNGVVWPCATYVCDDATGLCGTLCTLNTDCATGHTCNSLHQCVVTLVPRSSDSPSGCAVGSRSVHDTGVAAATLFAFVAARKVRRSTERRLSARVTARRDVTS